MPYALGTLLPAGVHRSLYVAAPFAQASTSTTTDEVMPCSTRWPRRAALYQRKTALSALVS